MDGAFGFIRQGLGVPSEHLTMAALYQAGVGT